MGSVVHHAVCEFMLSYSCIPRSHKVYLPSLSVVLTFPFLEALFKGLVNQILW